MRLGARLLPEKPLVPGRMPKTNRSSYLDWPSFTPP